MRTILIALSLMAVMAAAPLAQAKEGCGRGYHLNKHGVCVLNKKVRASAVTAVPVTRGVAPVGVAGVPCPAGMHVGPNGNCQHN